jgi:hypothetical protein
MSGKNTDLLGDALKWVAHTMGAKESPGRRVVSPDVKIIKPAEDEASVPRQAKRGAARPHDAQ